MTAVKIISTERLADLISRRAFACNLSAFQHILPAFLSVLRARYDLSLVDEVQKRFPKVMNFKTNTANRKESLTKLLHVLREKEDGILKALYEDLKNPAFESVITENQLRDLRSATYDQKPRFLG
ncbi:MAG: hypothetical protein KGQ89_08490 [Verrucomicrobia bacterium]|nr:hypothetical protein [Verrucomicrobiota bacterium]